jgi:hypothetical protein
MFTTFVIVWPVLVSVLAGLVGLRVFGALSPCIVLDVRVTSVSENIVVLRVEVRNTSRVTVKRSKALFAVHWIDAAELDAANGRKDCVIRDWVDFAGAEEILVSTETLHSNEVIVVERAYGTGGAAYVQTGLQFYSDPTRFQRVLRFLWPRSLRWTTTRIHSLSPATVLASTIYGTVLPADAAAGLPVA